MHVLQHFHMILDKFTKKDKTTFTLIVHIFFPLLRWMDGAFLDLDAEQVDGEVDEFSREIYKIQKVFNQKVKKMQMEIDEVNRDKKKKRRLAEDNDGEVNPEDQDVKLKIPEGFNICNNVMDQTKDFKVDPLPQ